MEKKIELVNKCMEILNYNHIVIYYKMRMVLKLLAI